MNTEPKEHTCDLCGKIPPASCDENTVEELKVDDYRTKRANYLGFPVGETHFVNGWKIKHNRALHTHVCDSCAEQHFVKIKRNAPRNAKIAGAVALFCIGLIIFFANIEACNEYGGIALILIAAIFLSLFAGGFYLNRVFADKSYSFDALHQQALKKLLGAAPKFWLPNSYPKAKGSVFLMKTKDWEIAAPKMAEMEAKTGWSHIQYLRSHSSTEEWTPEEGAAFKKIAHLGIYLDEPDAG